MPCNKPTAMNASCCVIRLARKMPWLLKIWLLPSAMHAKPMASEVAHANFSERQNVDRSSRDWSSMGAIDSEFVEAGEIQRSPYL